MKLLIPAGTTSKKVKIFVQDTSKTDGSGLTGLAYNTSGLTWYYTKDGDSSSTSITLSTATLGTWASGGLIVVDGTNMPGVYEIGVPNAAIASGTCHMILRGAANMAPVKIEIQTDNAPANTQQIAGQTASASGTITFPAATLASTTNITAASGITVSTNSDKTGYSLTQSFPSNFSSMLISAGGNVGIDWAHVANPTTTLALTGTTISTSQAVASVSGSVGSVTGNVGGSVGSVTAMVSANTIQLAGTAQTAGVDLGIVLPAAAFETQGGLSSDVAFAGTVASATSNTVVLTSALGANNIVANAYVNNKSGVGIGQSMIVAGYVDSSKTVNLSSGQTWAITPAVGSKITFSYNDSPYTDGSGAVKIQAGNQSGQLDFANGVVKSNLTQILGTTLTETAGYLAAGFKKFFNIASPSLTVGGTDQTGDSYARLGAPAGASTAADIAAINSKTTNLPASPASTTNITAGTITTVTNLTNAPTAGDLTAAMKASVTAAVPSAAAIATAVGLPSHFTNSTFASDGVFSTAALANAPGGGETVTVQNFYTVPAAIAQSQYLLGTIPIVRGDRLSVALPLMGNISSRSKLVLTCKLASQTLDSITNTDSQAVFQVVEGVGLTVFNGAAGIASHGSLTVTNATTGLVTLVLNATETAKIPLEDLTWDCQWLDSSTPPNPQTPIGGNVSITADVTQSVV